MKASNESIWIQINTIYMYIKLDLWKGIYLIKKSAFHVPNELPGLHSLLDVNIHAVKLWKFTQHLQQHCSSRLITWLSKIPNFELPTKCYCSYFMWFCKFDTVYGCAICRIYKQSKNKMTIKIKMLRKSWIKFWTSKLI